MDKYQEYWKKRNELMFLQGEKGALDTARDLERNYRQAITNIEDQINAFYGKYARTSNLDMSEVRKLLNRSELKSFKEYLSDIKAYAKEHKLDKNYTNELNKLSYKLRVSRLEELKTKMQFEVEKLTKQVQDKVENTLLKTYEEGYYRTIFNVQQFFQISSSFTELNLQAIRKAIGTPYMLQNYSDVLWKNKENLKYLLDTAVPQGIILGQNPNKVAQIASKKLTSNYKAAVRLIRTEYNLILNDGASKGYLEAGIDKYELLATLDDRTSEICQDLDGKVFNISQKEVGINYPPFHPNCRTTTIPYFEPDEFDEDNIRIARDAYGKNYYVSSKLKYPEWRAGLTKQRDGKVIYKN